MFLCMYEHSSARARACVCVKRKRFQHTWILRFTDDILLVANNQNKIEDIGIASQEVDLRINIKKTKQIAIVSAQ